MPVPAATAGRRSAAVCAPSAVVPAIGCDIRTDGTGPVCSAGCPTVCMVKIPKSSAANSSSRPQVALLVPDMPATLPPPGI